MQAVGVLGRVHPGQRRARVEPGGQRQLDDVAGAGRVGVELVDDRLDVGLGGGRRQLALQRGDARPAAQSRCLPATYDRLPGSSPTRTVPSPGTTPCSRSRATRVGQVGPDRGRGGLPVEDRRAHGRRVCHGLTAALAAQWKKCRSPVRYIVTPAAVAAAMTSSSRIDPPGCTTARTPAAISTSSPSANGKNASEAATAPGAPVPRPGHRQPGRVDPVHLAHADADGGAAGGQQDRVGLHRPAGPPGEGQVGERRRRRPACRRPASRSTGRRRRRRPGPRSAPAPPPRDLAQLDGSRRWPSALAAAGRSSCGSAPRTRPSSNAGATTTSVNTSASCSAIASGDRAVGRDHPAERGHRVAGVRRGAPRRRPRRPRSRTGWRA